MSCDRQTLYVGGAPARFDGGLSYIMDLETRSGRDREAHGRFGWTCCRARHAGGSAGRAGPLLASVAPCTARVRRAWILARFRTHTPTRRSRGRASGPGPRADGTGFWNDELVRLDTVGGARQTANWGNRAGSLRYRGGIGATQVLATVALAHFRTTLPLGGIRPLLTEGTALRGRLALDFEQPLLAPASSGAASLDHIDFEYRAFPQARQPGQRAGPERGGRRPAGCTPRRRSPLLPRLRVRGGMRADAFTLDGGCPLAPRLSATCC
jgi:hypothetical protein